MTGPDNAKRTNGGSRPIGRPEGARRKPLLTALPFCVVLILAAVGLTLVSAQARADSCTPGVGEVTRSDDSFTWTSLLSGTASWSGSVALREDVDSSCYVHHIYIDFGPERSGTLSINGSPYVSLTVQYPSAFTHSSDVALNAIGNLDEHNPQAGTYLTYTVQENRDINAAGADEYVVQGIGLAALVTDVAVGIELPLDFLGKTVYAQIHVGPDHCQCSVTAFTIPGMPPPPPPSPQVWDVYVHAHQDDWQLWESPDSYNHYQAGDHLLFVYTTAGDAGQNISRWGAREKGAQASVRYIVGDGAAEGSGSVNFCYTAGQGLLFHDQRNHRRVHAIRLDDARQRPGLRPHPADGALQRLRPLHGPCGPPGDWGCRVEGHVRHGRSLDPRPLHRLHDCLGRLAVSGQPRQHLIRDQEGTLHVLREHDEGPDRGRRVLPDAVVLGERVPAGVFAGSLKAGATIARPIDALGSPACPTLAEIREG